MIDTVGTFNAIKAAYEVYMKVSLAWPGMVCCALCALPPQNHGGVIINISATLYYTGTPMQAHAGSAKAAIGGLEEFICLYVFVYYDSSFLVQMP